MTSSSWRTIVVLTVIVCLAIIGTGLVQARVDQAQLDLACLSQRNQIEQLTALRSISHTLGLPPTFEIPALSEECR